MIARSFFLINFIFLVLATSFGQVVNGVDYLAILKKGARYDLNEKEHFPEFTYESSNDRELVALRKKYKLDSIAGFGNETSRLLNLLHWIHNTIKHDGQNESPVKIINADEILNIALTQHVGVSCGELAITLNDCYLAMGWPSRKIYCFPKDSLKVDVDSHVINIVYLSSKHKWIWVDPTHDAYVMDEKGELLSIEEVRLRLINNESLIVNPDANWNHRISDTNENYLDTYMAKNLYRMFCPLYSEYSLASFDTNQNSYVELVPLDYSQNISKKNNRIITHNPTLFWAAPKEN